MIQIRKAQETDADAIAELEGTAFPSDCWNANTVKGEIRSGSGFVVEDKKGLVAYAIIRLDEDLTDVTRLAVHPRARRQGVATRLLRHTFDWAASNVILCVEMANEPAIRLYKSLGFVPIAEHSGRAILERRGG